MKKKLEYQDFKVLENALTTALGEKEKEKVICEKTSKADYEPFKEMFISEEYFRNFWTAKKLTKEQEIATMENLLDKILEMEEEI